MSIDLINSFVEKYISELTKYELTKDKLIKILKLILSDAGIMAITSARTKDPERLRQKLIARDSKERYSSINDIYDDIPDLVGGRIALYFPGDICRIKVLLEQHFYIVEEKTFPKEQHDYRGYERRFDGYTATHYRVRFKKEITSIDYVIEIQVASLLMHAWAEVEHDLAYKMMKGIVSYEEYETLDEINGLMIAGEISLQRLQRLTQSRIQAKEKTISNHYELAMLLYDRIVQNNGIVFNDIGDTESLYKLYKKQDRLTLKKIDNDLKKVDFSSNVPLADQLIDLHAGMKYEDSKLIIENKASKAIEKIKLDDEVLGAFIKAWIKLEKNMNKAYVNTQPEEKFYSHHDRLPKEQILPGYIREEYYGLRRIRNNIVHGGEMPSVLELKDFTGRIETINRYLGSLLANSQTKHRE